MMRIGLSLLVLVAAHDLASARCARALVGSSAMTKAGATVAGDGGLIVKSSVSFDAAPPGADSAINPTWRFSDGTKEYEPVLVTLAPGLVTYKPPAGVSGSLTLVDGKKTRGSIKVGTDTPQLLGAPQLKTVKRRLVPQIRANVVVLEATLAAAAPAGAVAIVVYGVTDKGNVPRSWWTVTAGVKKARVGGTAARCSPGLPGEIVSKAGDQVVLAWVDASGRLSAFSKPIKVTGT